MFWWYGIIHTIHGHYELELPAKRLNAEVEERWERREAGYKFAAGFGKKIRNFVRSGTYINYEWLTTIWMVDR